MTALRQRVEWSRSIFDATRVSTIRRDETHATRDPRSYRGGRPIL